MSGDSQHAKHLLSQQAGYWAGQTATVDGMLGGFGHVDPADVEGSLAFIDKLLPLDIRKQGRALDCGAGIGRVTKHVLIPSGFKEVDLMDVSDEFLAKAVHFVDSPVLANRYASGLAEFDFDTAAGRTWDLIWVQWCAIYLEDDPFVEFFQRAAAALRSETESYIVLKENVLSKKDAPPVFDTDDSSQTRSVRHLLRLFKRAGLAVRFRERQRNMPEELFPVVMFALQPDTSRKRRRCDGNGDEDGDDGRVGDGDKSCDARQLRDAEDGGSSQAAEERGDDHDAASDNAES
eukprot:m.27311 g.27311  ORF g.27311 m.27311 type:complete len:291 (+) comp4742_c0_seq1:3-875(+)